MATVRPHSIAPEQSLAAPNRDSSHKRPGLFKRYKPRPSGSIPTSLAPSMPQASSSPSLQSSSSRSYRNRKKMLTPPTTNPMQWLQRNCPQDLIPRVLAFAGPQMMAVIANTNRFWNNFVKKESTWKTLSEELYKVSCVFAGMTHFFRGIRNQLIPNCFCHPFFQCSGKKVTRSQNHGETFTDSTLVSQLIIQASEKHFLWHKLP